MIAQIPSERPCIVCGRPMTGTATARRGRPQRTHAGACKIRSDRMHRRAKRLEEWAVRFVTNGNPERGAQLQTEARRVRALLDELPRSVHEDADGRLVLARARAARRNRGAHVTQA